MFNVVLIEFPSPSQPANLSEIWSKWLTDLFSHPQPNESLQIVQFAHME